MHYLMPATWTPRPGKHPDRAPRTAPAALALLVLLTALVSLAAASPLAAADLSGHLTLMAKNGKGPARGTDARLAVVYFEPAPAGAAASGPPGTTAHAAHPAKESDAVFQLLTKNKEFLPHVLVVPVGSRVQFPNQDPILHNVFSVSPGNAFDLGIYRTGPPKEKRFEQPGLVRVYCNVHQAMVAYILVLDTNAVHTSPAADGSFRLTGLPKGPGKLTIWHEQVDPWSTQLTLPLPEDAPPVQARLVVVRPKLPQHLTKTGEAYASGDAYR